MQKRDTKSIPDSILKNSISFHGHLGPYLVLGLLMGEFALSQLRCRKYFGLKTHVKGASLKPKSCLIDGLQISTGCTYGKGNIKKMPGRNIEAIFYSLKNRDKIKISLKKELTKKLSRLKGHADSESFAMKLRKSSPYGLFNLKNLT